MDVILDALDWAAEQEVRIVNMSFVGPDNELLEAACADARERDLVLVAAAGNNGPKAPYGYPAAYPGVIAVTATDDEDQADAAGQSRALRLRLGAGRRHAGADRRRHRCSSPALPSPPRSSAAPSPTCCTTTPDRSADWIEKALAETVVRSRRRRAATRTSASASSTPKAAREIVKDSRSVRQT